jgi:hypothetical protein
MVPVTKADGEKLAKDLGAVKYVECSALTQYELKDVFDKVRVGSSCYFNFDLLAMPRGCFAVRVMAWESICCGRRNNKKSRVQVHDILTAMFI